MKAVFSALCFVWAALAVAESPLHASLEGKVVTGYQGWFRAQGDASGLGWVHYGRGKGFSPQAYSFDIWPDLSEFTPEERYPSPFKFADGKTADLFSSVHPLTVRRHFRWMRDHGIDGAMLQRFAVGLGKSRGAESLDVVLRNCTEAAIAEGRALTVMYDLSGLTPDKFPTVAADWRRLVDAGQTRLACAQHHQGKPLVALWGIGFKDRAPGLSEWNALLADIKATGAAVMLGIPTYWRELKNDSIPDPALHALLRQADILSPWTVGRYGDPKGAEKLAQKIWTPDLAWCQAEKKAYLPVIFPGFSWSNLSALRGQKAKLDQIPRLGGRFLWSQAVAARAAGAKTLYVAMFDEIDEGTAIMKCGGPRPDGNFVDLSDVPTDHYLWLSGQAGRMLRGEIPASSELPRR
ncbi:MAG: xylosidase/arabinosidase [Verrucomicrobia bacterium]|nr:xylosidase/arabinosidase [Verrucomicrobiota bacterium]